tara:strand:- start:6440 stop:7321 length:882 start_codon:yes stop_codon:yes gene_type:complete
MKIEWKGKSKGSVTGYKIFVFFIKNFGINSAYFILYFVASYYLFFSIKTNKSIYYYFRERQKFSIMKSVISIYKSYYILGQTLIDKIAFSFGLDNKYIFDFKGVEDVKKGFKEKKGGIFLSAHVGNFEIAHKVLKKRNSSLKINIVTIDNENLLLKEYLNSINKINDINFIEIKDDFSHLFKINNALSNDEWICVTGDRYIKGSKFIESNLLNKKAKFPAGIFELASILKVPVIFVYNIKKSKNKYTSYAKIAKFKHKESKYLLDLYTNNLEWILKKYPLQWFNYFDFWNDLN